MFYKCNSIVFLLDAVDGLKKQFAQLQGKKQSILLTIEQEEIEYAEMLRTNEELREQRNTLLERRTQMTDQLEVMHAEVSRESSSKCDVFK